MSVQTELPLHETPRTNVRDLMRAMALHLGGWFRISARGVPHVVVTVPGWRYRFSVCYFASTDKYKVFYPYAMFNMEQHKTHCGSEAEVINLFEELREIAERREK